MESLDYVQNFWWVLLVIAFVAALAALFNRKFWPQDWRLLECLALLFGAAGLLSPAFEAHGLAYNIEAKEVRRWAYVDLKQNIESYIYRLKFNCIDGTRTTFSPPDFDQIESEKQEVCDWTSKLQDQIKDFTSSKMSLITDDLKAEFPEVREIPIGPSRAEIFERIDTWNSQIQSLGNLEKKGNTRLPPWLVFISPFLLFAGFSVALAVLLVKPRANVTV